LSVEVVEIIKTFTTIEDTTRYFSIKCSYYKNNSKVNEQQNISFNFVPMYVTIWWEYEI
jgi:hypothetical protein